MTAMALLVLAAFIPSVASASWFVSEDDGTVSGEAIAVEGGKGIGHILEFWGGQFECEGADLSNAPIEFPGAESLAPALAEPSCHIGGGTPSLKPNGCTFIFHPGAETEPGRFQGTVNVGPANCGPMTMKYSTCIFSFYPGTGFEAEFENQGSGKEATVEVSAQITGLDWSGTRWCTANEEVHSNASYRGSWELSAENEVGEQTGLEVNAETWDGIYVEGEESEEEANQPRLGALAYPVAIRGGHESELNGEGPFTLAGSNLQCERTSFESEATAATAQLQIDPHYEGACKFGGLGSTVHLNSCAYDLNILNLGPPYSGDLDVSCGEEGDAIEISTTLFGSPICTTTIPPQQGIGAIGLSSGWGTVDLALELGGIEYSIARSSGLCPGEGEVYEASDGTYVEDLELNGWQ